MLGRAEMHIPLSIHREICVQLQKTTKRHGSNAGPNLEVRYDITSILKVG